MRRGTGCTLFVSLLLIVVIWVGAAFAQSPWAKRHNGPGSGIDFGTAIAVDVVGNVYVTGRLNQEVCSNPSVMVCGDFGTIKYDTNGKRQWLSVYNGTGGDHDVANAIAVDRSGNTIVAGESWGGKATSYDYAVVKYEKGGQEDWVRRYNGPGNGFDGVTAMVVDGAGNVYVTGYSLGKTRTDWDYATIKYSKNGTCLWKRRYNGPARGDDSARAIAVDSDGNVFVTGESKGRSGRFDFATVKYDASGRRIWVKRYNGPGNGDDYARDIAIDQDSNIFVTGGSEKSAGDGFLDFATVKYAPDGSRLWSRRYEGVDGAWGIALDDSGRIYVGGTAVGEQSNAFGVLKYNSNGRRLWAQLYESPVLYHEFASGIAADPHGNVAITGISSGTGDSVDIGTVKYDASGSFLWAEFYDGPRHDSDYPMGIAMDNAGNVYVTGNSEDDFITLKYLH
jgi:uncharacterized delta-60 repeat protein